MPDFSNMLWPFPPDNLDAADRSVSVPAYTPQLPLASPIAVPPSPEARMMAGNRVELAQSTDAPPVARVLPRDATGPGTGSGPLTVRGPEIQIAPGQFLTTPGRPRPRPDAGFVPPQLQRSFPGGIAPSPEAGSADMLAGGTGGSALDRLYAQVAGQSFDALQRPNAIRNPEAPWRNAAPRRPPPPEAVDPSRDFWKEFGFALMQNNGYEGPLAAIGRAGQAGSAAESKAKSRNAASTRQAWADDLALDKLLREDWRAGQTAGRDLARMELDRTKSVADLQAKYFDALARAQNSALDRESREKSAREANGLRERIARENREDRLVEIADATSPTGTRLVPQPQAANKPAPSKERGTTPTQQARNQDILAARRSLEGMSRDQILAAAQQFTPNGRPNPNFNPFAARAARIASRRLTGEEDLDHGAFWGRMFPDSEGDNAGAAAPRAVGPTASHALPSPAVSVGPPENFQLPSMNAPLPAPAIQVRPQRPSAPSPTRRPDAAMPMVGGRIDASKLIRGTEYEVGGERFRWTGSDFEQVN